jgi:hypothetical protein
MRATLLDKTPQQTIDEYDAKLASYVIVSARVPLWRRILRRLMFLR